MKASLINLNDTNSKDLLKLGNQPKVSNKDFGSTLEKFSSKTEDNKINDNNKTKTNEEKKRDNKVEKKSEDSRDKKIDSKDKKEVESEEEIKDLPKEKVNYEDVLSLIQSLLVDVEVDLEDIDAKLNQIVEEVAIGLDMEPVDVEQELVNLLENMDLDQFKTKGEFTKESSFLEKVETELKIKLESNSKNDDEKIVEFKLGPDSKDSIEDLSKKESNLNGDQSMSSKENLNGEINQVDSSRKNKDIKNISKEVDLETGEEIEVETSSIDEPFMPLIKDKLNFNISNKLKVEEPVDVNPKEVVEQIVNKVKVDLTDNKNHIKLSLKPEALGNMTMDIEINKGGVIAKIIVDNYKTKEMIESNIVQLKEGIEDTGMEIKTVEVYVGNNADFNHKEQRHFNFNQENKKFKNTNRLKISNNYEDAIVVEEVSNPNNPYEEDGFDLMA